MSMLILITLTPIMFNLRSFFGLGVYNIEDDYFNSYSDGTAGINLHLHINHELDNRYIINTFIEPISTGNVVNYGLLSIIIHYLNDNEPVFGRSVQFGTPTNNYSVYRFPLDLAKYDNLTCYGTIEMSLETGGIPNNDTINFQLTFIVPLGIGDYMNLDLLIYLFFPTYFLLYIIIPVILIWIFKPVFGFSFSEEDLKKDEEFLNYLQNQDKEKEKESKN